MRSRFTLTLTLLLLLPGAQARAQGPAPQPDSTESAKTAASAAATATMPMGWFGKGLLGGGVAGPLGLLFVYHRASNAQVTLPSAIADSLADSDPAYAYAYRAAYEDARRQRVREASAAGGLIGTGVWIVAMFQLLHLSGKGSTAGPPGGSGTTPALIVPLSGLLHR